MKNLFTYLKALWSRVADSQSTDVRHDCRRSDLRRSPSGLDAKWKQNPFMRFAVVLTLIFTIGSGNAWGTTASLTNAEIKAATAGNSYASRSVTSSSGTWSGTMIINTSTGYVQINKNKNNYYLGSPTFAGGVTQVSIETNNNTASGRVFYICSSTSTAQPTSGDLGQGSTPSSNGTATISITGSPTSFYIYSNGGAYIKAVTVTYTAACAGTQLETPEVTTTPSNQQIQLSWPAVDHATKYQVSWNGGAFADATSPYTKSSITNGTSYTWAIKAIGNGSTYCDSEVNEGTTKPGSTIRTVTWKVNGETYATTYVASGDHLMLPASPSPCAVGKVFAGWSETNIGSTPTDTKPTFISSQTTISANKTYHAVFATRTANSYTKGNINDLFPGQTVLIVNETGNVALSDEAVSGKEDQRLKPVSVTISSSKITSMSNTHLIWTVENRGLKYNFKTGTGYLRATASGNDKLSCGSGADPWTLTANSGKYYMNSTNSGTSRIQYYSSGTCFQTYGSNATGNNYSMSFFVPTFTQYITQCCTQLGSINGSVTLSQLATPNPTKLKATWSMNATTGIASYDLEVYNSSNVKVKTINNYTSGDEITGLDPCTTYYVKLYTVSSGSPYCDGGLIGTSSSVTTNGYTYTINPVNVSLKDGETEATNSCEDFMAEYVADAGYDLPTTISVTGASSYTWEDGVLMIDKADVTGNVTVTITGTAQSNFINGETVFIQADSKDYSAWKDDVCVKAWFNASGAGGAAQTTYWLFDATDTDAGKKLFAAIVPSTGDLNQVTLQRFQSDCLAEHWYNNNGTLTKASSGGVNTFRSYGSADNNVAWNGSSTTLNLYGSQNSWASSLATLTDQGAGVWTASINNYTPDATSKEYKIKTSYNQGWIGNGGSNDNATLSGMKVGSTYNVTATLNVTTHALTMSKTFVKGTVHFNLQGHGLAISDLTNVTAGSKISAPSAPSATGYTFGGWYKEPACTNAWNFASDEVNETMTLYAKWTANVYTITKTFSNVANAGLPASFTYTGATTTALNSTFTVDATNFFLPSSIAVTMGGTPLTAGTDYTYNNSTGAFTFSAVITGNIVITATATAKLKSIAITTQPTTRKYLVGDVFSSTGAVVTATMGDGSTKAVTASATWTPAGALSAGTSQTVTATYTEAGIEKTATTTIDVYSVTVNKVDMDGNAIADAGVTASCSGRTLSQSVSTTNYKFNSWVLATASGTSLSTNTLTGTPTGNVVVNAKFHKPITVTWKVGSGAASGGTSEVQYGTAIAALPSTPADNALASCGTNKFMGWSAAGELKGTGHDAPADLFTTVGGATTLTENTTYRAVFANGSGSGSEGYNKVTSTGNITNDGRYLIVYESGNVAFNGNLTTLDASSNVVTATVSTSAIAVNDDNRTTLANAEFSIDMTNKYIKSHSKKYINYNSYGGGLTASADATAVHSISIDGSGNLVIEGTGQNSSSPYDYVVLRFNSNTGSGNWRFRFYKGTQQAIQLYKYDPGTTYSDYQTGCCEAPGTALSITSANSVATGGTVSLTSTGGNGGTVTWSVVNGTGSATIEGTTLTAGTVGTVTVKAHQNANTVLGTEYCAQDAEQAFTVVSATVNVTGVTVDPTSKAILVGETFTITPTVTPANATDKSVSWTSSASDKASVSSGTVTGVAAGTATITCTTTDGSHTATCATTVYSASVTSIVDEDGTDISASGVTATISGRTLTASEGSTNYKFKTWKYGTASGTSISSATSLSTSLTGTPTGNVTLIAEFYKPVTVAWTKGGTTYFTGGPTTSVKRGTQWKDLTIPTAPGDATLGACANKFKGWSNCSDLIGTGHSAPGVLFTSVSGITTAINDPIEFKAVFATENTGTWTLDYSKETALSSSTAWSYGTGLSYTASDGGTWVVKANKSSGMQINAGKNSSIKIPDCSGDITSIVVTGAAKTVRFSRSDYDGSSFGVIEVTGSDAYTQTLDFAGKSLTAGYIVPYTNANQITKIVVNYGSTSDYVTQCDPNQVKVTYAANGGSTTCAGGSHDKRNDYTVCSSAPTRDYYTFAGWLCSADDEVYAASATIDDAVIDADFSLTAQWTPVTYNITYNLHGGTTAGGNPTTYDVETATIDLADGTYGHNRFEGWYSTYNDGTGAYSDQVTSIPLGSHEDITLHAKWTTRHEIVFDADGETTTIYRADDEAMDASVAEQGSVPSDPSAPSTCSTKVFVGWSESEIDDETNTRPGDLMKPAEGKVDEDKHYYAVWALRAGSPAPATYAGTGTFVKITSMSEVETDTYYVLRGIDGSTVKVMKNTISSSKMGTADDPVSENVITNPGVAIVWKLGGKKDAYTLYNQSVSKYVEITANATGGYALNASPTSGATYTLTIEDGHGFFFKSNYSTANSRGISIYNASEFRSYGLANAKTLELYKLPAYTYSAYSTSCCETKVNLTHNSPEHGTVEFNKSRIGTCNSDKNVSLTIIPDVGYQLTGWTVNTSSGYADAKTTSPAVVTNSNNSAAQNITLTFAEDANKDYDVTATFGLMTVTSWAWTVNSTAIPDPLNLYVGQSARLDVAYTPAGVDASKKTYGRTKEDAYINWVGGAYATYSTISGKASTGENTTPVTFTHGDGPTTTVNVKVLPLPLVHFGDIVHNVSFDDVVATLSDNTLSPTKTTPTHADFEGSTANTCEEQHLHLVGWIREDWPALVTYLNGGAQPSTSDITSAGDDASGNAYFFTPGASINTQTFNGVTFYAVWAKVE